jgi:hypothetical protein
MTKCFRNPAAASLPRRGITAWVLDKFEPEFDRYIDEQHDEQDAIIVPLRSGPIESYRWTTKHFRTVAQALFATWKRSLGSRRLAAQGAERQRALLKFDQALAEAFSRKIPHIADHLVVSQNLLPYLWQHGDLSGRTFDVLMTRLPILDLERTLDAASRAHPESKTLSDFRASLEVREAESEALSAARFWVTPHSDIAKIDPARTIKLDWQLPEKSGQIIRPQKIVFPASTLARKGCYEMRDLARELKMTLQIAGPVLEAPDFWADIDGVVADGDWLENAALVVLPAWVEHWPRRLLLAAAAGVPVIATRACGLSGVLNVTEIPTGDAEALRLSVAKALDLFALERRVVSSSRL